MALQPFQYATGLQTSRPVDFDVTPVDYMQGLPAITEGLYKMKDDAVAKEALDKSEAAKKAAIDKFAAMKKDMAAAMKTQDPKVINDTLIKHSELQEAFQIAEQNAAESEASLNASQEFRYKFLQAKDDKERDKLIEARTAVLNERGAPPEQRKSAEALLKLYKEGSTEDVNRAIHTSLMIGDNKRYNQYLENIGAKPPGKKDQTTDIQEYEYAVANNKYKGTLAEWKAAGGGGGEGGMGAGTATGEDRYVADAVQAWVDEDPTNRAAEKAPAVLKKKWRMEYNRKQKDEAYDVTKASETAKGDTAFVNNYNAEMGKVQAEIETATAVTHAKGERTPEEKRISGAQDMTTKLSALRSLYTKLDEQGGIVNTKKKTMNNVLAAAEASAGGQLVGRVIGSKNQQLRNSVETIRPMLIQDIRKASEMGTRGLDSEKELAFYMKAATDTGIDIDTNMAALAMLDTVYGSGELAAEIRSGIPPERQESFNKEVEKLATEGQEILNGRDMKTVSTQAQFDSLEPGAAYYEKGDPTVYYKPLR